jgi:hypothetical protein
VVQVPDSHTVRLNLLLYRAWHRIGGREMLDAYAYTRQILVRTFLHETRGGFFRREQVTDEQADRVAPAAASPEDRGPLRHGPEGRRPNAWPPGHVV